MQRQLTVSMIDIGVDKITQEAVHFAKVQVEGIQEHLFGVYGSIPTTGMFFITEQKADAYFHAITSKRMITENFGGRLFNEIMKDLQGQPS